MTNIQARNHLTSGYRFLKRNAFLLTYIPWLVFQLLHRADFPIGEHVVGDWYEWSEYFAYFMLTAQILLLNRYSWKELIGVGVLTAIFAVSAYRTEYNYLLIYWLFLAAARDEEPERIIRTTYVTLICVVSTVFLCFFLGYLPDAILISGKGTIRHSLGFVHPNTTGLLVMEMVLCHLYLQRKQIDWKDLALVVLAAVFVYVVPNSRTAFLCLGLAIGFTLYLIALRKWQRLSAAPVMRLMVAFAVLCNISCVLLSMAYRENRFFLLLDRLMSSRLSYCNIIFSVYGVSALGAPLAEMYTMAEYNGISFFMPWLDASYMELLLRYGALAYGAFSCLFLGAMWKLCKNRHLVLLGIFAIYAAHGMMEPTLYDLRYNVFVLAMAGTLLSRPAANK